MGRQGRRAKDSAVTDSATPSVIACSERRGPDAEGEAQGVAGGDVRATQGARRCRGDRTTARPIKARALLEHLSIVEAEELGLAVLQAVKYARAPHPRSPAA